MKEDKTINVNSLLYEEFAAEGDDISEPTDNGGVEPLWSSPTPSPCPCCFTTDIPVHYDKCDFEETKDITTTVNCVGRFLEVNVTLTNICPQKYINIGVLVYEKGKLVTFKVCKFFTDATAGTCLTNAFAGKFCFTFDEATACPDARDFTIKIVANYVF